MLAFLLGTIAFVASCAKDGEQGPAGANGTDHTAVSAADKTAFDGANGFTGGLLYDHLMKYDFLVIAGGYPSSMHFNLEIYDNSAAIKVESRSDYRDADKPTQMISLTLRTIDEDIELVSFLKTLNAHARQISS